MSFLYGDLTPAPFTTSVLEEVRETIEFAAALADADQCIVTINARREELRRRADREKRRIDGLVDAMSAASARADKGEVGSAASGLASHFAKVIADGRNAAVASVERRLADDIKATEKETLEARADYFPMLERYLLVRVPPASTEVRRIELVGSKKDERHYTAGIVARSKVGLDWSIELGVPIESAWTKPIRVDDFADRLTITAPQLAGLLKKEVKSKDTKLDRHFVTRVIDDDAAPLHVELRDEIGAAEGFDLDVDLAENAIVIAKTGDAEDDESVGPFELAEEDREAVLAFATKLRAEVRSFTKNRLVRATFDRAPFDGENTEAQPKLVALVARLADTLSPLLGEISSRSRSEDELVLRRVLDDGRREELYLPKSRLRDLLDGLDTKHLDMFASLEAALSTGQGAETHTIDVESPAAPVRSEVPRSTGSYVRRDSNKRFVAVRVPPPPPADAPALEIVSEAPEPRPPRSSKSGLMDPEEIAAVATAGDPPEAFRRYAALFGSPSFHKQGVEEQRRALELMIHGDVGAAPTDEMRAAYRAAIPVLQALVVAHRDPADYQMLGISYVALAEPESAREMFKKALEIEKARNSSSDLFGELTRRVSQL
jgi:hypothetical protein